MQGSAKIIGPFMAGLSAVPLHMTFTHSVIIFPPDTVAMPAP